jgi:hypothetical protein
MGGSRGAGSASFTLPNYDAQLGFEREWQREIASLACCFAIMQKNGDLRHVMGCGF